VSRTGNTPTGEREGIDGGNQKRTPKRGSGAEGQLRKSQKVNPARRRAAGEHELGGLVRPTNALVLGKRGTGGAKRWGNVDEKMEHKKKTNGK